MCVNPVHAVAKLENFFFLKKSTMKSGSVQFTQSRERNEMRSIERVNIVEFVDSNASDGRAR